MRTSWEIDLQEIIDFAIKYQNIVGCDRLNYLNTVQRHRTLVVAGSGPLTRAQRFSALMDGQGEAP
jgi:hypothetical protein